MAYADNTLNGAIGTVAGKLDEAPSVVMSELQKVEQLVFNLYNKLDSVVVPAPTNQASTQAEPSSNLLSTRLRLVSTTLEHILTNIEL